MTTTSRHLSGSRSFATGVRALLREQMERGAVQADAIARRLHMSRYTLYRRLKRENQSFAAMLEDVRRQAAHVYLAGTGIPLCEIALKLGFSEQSAFSRAFRRWTGVSPLQYRLAPFRGEVGNAPG